MSAASPPVDDSATKASLSPGGNQGGVSATAPQQQQQQQQRQQQQQTAQTIASIMFGGAFDPAQWSRVEAFASEKAREMRTERLKRGNQHIAPDTHFGSAQPPSRRIVKPKRRHSSASAHTNTGQIF